MGAPLNIGPQITYTHTADDDTYQVYANGLPLVQITRRTDNHHDDTPITDYPWEMPYGFPFPVHHVGATPGALIDKIISEAMALPQDEFAVRYPAHVSIVPVPPTPQVVPLHWQGRHIATAVRCNQTGKWGARAVDRSWITGYNHASVNEVCDVVAAHAAQLAPVTGRLVP